jgi:NAD(P)H-dependent FMN reductase
MKLNIIIGSTRPGRIGPKVAQWVDTFAREHGKFDVNLVDLADFALPVYDEPKHPVMQDYAHAHTKAWAESVASADAYVFVTPEYNYFPPASLINALTYLSREWAYKPAAVVSYGGISGGLRATQQLRLMLTTVKVMPIPEGVPVPLVGQMITPEAGFTPTQPVIDGTRVVLDELHKWATALAPMRQ